MKKSIMLFAAVAAFATGNAKTIATDSLVRNYMRSSLYTVILNSDEQNAYYEKVTKNSGNASALMSIAKDLAKTDAKREVNGETTGNVFSLPARLFPTIEIPNQFNDHNLKWRVLNYDSIKATVTFADLEKYGSKKKKGGFGKFVKAAAGADTHRDDIKEDYEKYSRAVMHKFFNAHNVAPGMIAKWFDYDANRGERWSISTVIERGNYNFTQEELNRAADDMSVQAKISNTAFNMISNTFVLAVNLRFRSYQDIVDEAAAAAKLVGSQFGALGSLVANVATDVATVSTGEGFAVQIVSDLYRLKWNDDYNRTFALEVFEKNATFEDLVASGICELEYVGTENASARVRQSLFSDQPINLLVKRATARAIDESIIKLQNSHEEFRTVLPILGGDGNVIYAAIGTKEGLVEGDEYEILQANEDKNGRIFYKSVGTVKPVKGKIWNNAYGAREEVLDNPKVSDAERTALSYGYSEFKGKKGDYTGYYLRLKKKK